MPHAPDAERQRRHEYRADCKAEPEFRARTDQKQQRGEYQIELLLDRNRPQMQQRLLVRSHIEVAGLVPELEIRREERRCQQRLAETGEGNGKEKNRRHDGGDREHGEQRRENTANSPFVEAAERKTAFSALFQDETGNQKAGNDEEDVHAHIAAAEARHAVVEQQHCQYGERAQSVDVRPIGPACARHDLPISTDNAPAGIPSPPRRFFWTGVLKTAGPAAARATARRDTSNGGRPHRWESHSVAPGSRRFCKGPGADTPQSHRISSASARVLRTPSSAGPDTPPAWGRVRDCCARASGAPAFREPASRSREWMR